MRVKKLSYSLLAFTVATVLAPPCAFASGYPQAEQIVFSDDDPSLIIVRASFGLIISHDHARSFEWVASYELRGLENDLVDYRAMAVSAITGAGTLVTATSKGLVLSHDHGCTWTNTGSGPLFMDLAKNPNDSHNVLALASSGDHVPKGTYVDATRIVETRDDGQSFLQLGNAFPRSLAGVSVAIAKTDPNRIYVIGRDLLDEPATRSLLYTSVDRGLTWSAIDVTTIGNETDVFIAGVDPTNARRVYLRTYASTSPSRLLLHEESDATSTPVSPASPASPAFTRVVFDARTGLSGFAFSSDGTKVYAGSPIDGLVVANTADALPSFQHVSRLPITCLATNSEGLWACSHDASRQPARLLVGLSHDDGLTFQMNLPSCATQGPLACSPDVNAVASPQSSIEADCNGDTYTTASAPVYTPPAAVRSPLEGQRPAVTSCALGGPSTGSDVERNRNMYSAWIAALGIVLCAVLRRAKLQRRFKSPRV